MEKLKFSNVLKGLSFVIPLLYAILGCLMLTDMFFPNVDRWKRVAFGVVLILYGIFRGYKAYTANMRDIS